MDTLSIIVMIISSFLLLACSAFFSGSETALMAVNRLRLTHLAKTEPRKVRVVEHLLKKPDQLIGTILLGNNLVNVAMTAIATALAIAVFGEVGIAYVIAVLTFAILLFAEITPKIYAKYYNERISLVVAPVLKTVMSILNPIIVALTFLANRLLLLLRIDVSKMKRPLITEAEIQTYIEVGKDEGAVTGEEKKILSRVFTLNDKTVRDVMVPKDRMTTLAIDAPLEQIMRTILRKRYSRYPVNRGKDKDITGFIHTKDLLRYVGSKGGVSIEKTVRPPYFVPESRKIDAQLRSFQARKLHQAVVLDSEGAVAGLITLEDILEELVGSIQDEHDQT